MEILGVEKATTRQIMYLRKLFENTIMHATMLKIARQSMMQRGLLQQQDIEYIRSSKKQCLLLFPVDNRITDRLALLHYFKATLQRRFLMPIKITSKTTHSHPAFLHSQTVTLAPLEKTGANELGSASTPIAVPDTPAHRESTSSSKNSALVKHAKSFPAAGADDLPK